jgi:hypothetical protein
MGCLLNPFGEQTDKELSQWDKGNQKEGVRKQNPRSDQLK